MAEIAAKALPTKASLHSFWLAQALAADPAEPTVLSGTVRADVCVVGGGYTGLWTAIEMKEREPSLRVAIVDAGLCGSGASGTNAGMLMNLWPKYPLLKAAVGAAEAGRLAQASSDAIDDIIDFCARHGIDADVRQAGWLWAATSRGQQGAWAETMEALSDVPGCPLIQLDADEARKLGSEGVVGGVLDPTCATLQPAALARGLRRVAVELGVDVYEHSPMLRVNEQDATVTVYTPDGAVRCDRAVLGINAWAIGLPGMQRSLLMTVSHNAATEVLPPRVLERVGHPGVGIADSHALLNYWRTTPDGRLVFGKGGADVAFGNRGASTAFGQVRDLRTLRKHYSRVMPEIRAELRHTWQAPVEYSLSSLPFFISVNGFKRVFVGTGYSGDGMGPSRVGAKILASLATGVVDEWSRSGLTVQPTRRLPPEPIRFLGGKAVRHAIVRVDEGMDEGRQVDPLTGILARLNPARWL